MLSIAYYITGHGLGHATRSVELITGLLRTGKFKICSVSNVSKDFFLQEFEASAVLLHDEEGNNLYEHYNRNLDTGGIQLDVIRMDSQGSLQAYLATIHKHRTALLEQEVSWLKANSINLILLDATPIGSIAGQLAGIPAVFVTNFTWDYVFREMLTIIQANSSLDSTILAAYEDMVEQCARDVCSCSAIIRYPGFTPLPALFDPVKVLSAPLISRPIRNRTLRKDIGLVTDEKLLLLGFGGHTVDWKLRDDFLPEGWRCIVLRADPKLMPSNRFSVAAYDSYIPDYIHASDVVLGKIGYGFVSECLTAGTPLVFVPRVDWPEEAHLEHLLTAEYDAGVSIPLEEYESGNWSPYLEQALRKKGGWQTSSASATQEVVATIEKLLFS